MIYYSLTIRKFNNSDSSFFNFLNCSIRKNTFFFSIWKQTFYSAIRETNFFCAINKVFFYLVVWEFKDLKPVWECCLCCFCLRKIVYNLAIGECLLYIIVIKLYNWIPIRPYLSFDSIREDYFFFSVWIYSLDLAIMTYYFF